MLRICKLPHDMDPSSHIVLLCSIDWYDLSCLSKNLVKIGEIIYPCKIYKTVPKGIIGMSEFDCHTSGHKFGDTIKVSTFVFSPDKERLIRFIDVDIFTSVNDTDPMKCDDRIIYDAFLDQFENKWVTLGQRMLVNVYNNNIVIEIKQLIDKEGPIYIGILTSASVVKNPSLKIPNFGVF